MVWKGCIEGMGGCLQGVGEVVWKVWGCFLEDVRRLSKRSRQAVWKV